MHRRFLPCLAVGLLFTACGREGERPAPPPGSTSAVGFTFNSDSGFRTLNGRNYRNGAESDLAKEITTRLSGGWTAEVAIAEDPRYFGEEEVPWNSSGIGSRLGTSYGRADGDDYWRWLACSVTVTLVGPAEGSAEPPVDPDKVRGFVQRSLQSKMHDPKTTPTVAVQARRALPAAAPVVASVMPGWGDAPSASAALLASATPSASAAAPTPGASTAAAAPTLVSYRVQPGDSLAAIAVAFYGSPERWRHILDANPGLDPSNLQPGQVIRVPLLPAGAGR